MADPDPSLVPITGGIISSDTIFNFLKNQLIELYDYTKDLPSTILPPSIFNNTSNNIPSINSISDDFFVKKDTLSAVVKTLRDNAATTFKSGEVIGLKELVDASISAITYASNIRYCECITHTDSQYNIKNNGFLFLSATPTMSSLLKSPGTSVNWPYAAAVTTPLSNDYRYNFATRAINDLTAMGYTTPSNFNSGGQIYLSTNNSWLQTLSSKTVIDNSNKKWGPLTDIVNTKNYADLRKTLYTGKVIKAEDVIKLCHTLYHVTNVFRWNLSCKFGYEAYTLVYVYDTNCFSPNQSDRPANLSVDDDTHLSCYCQHIFNPSDDTEITIINPLSLSIGFKLREDQVQGNYYLSAEFRGWSTNTNAKQRGAYLKADINYSSGVKVEFKDIKGAFNTKKKLYIYPVFNGHFYNKTNESEKVSTGYITLVAGSNNYTFDGPDSWQWHNTKTIYELKVIPDNLGSVYNTFTPNSLSVYDGRANSGNPVGSIYGHQIVQIKSYFNSRFELSVRENIAIAQNRADGGGLTFNVSSENNTTVDARWGCQYNTKSAWRRFPTEQHLQTSLSAYTNSLTAINSNLYNNVTSANIASTLSNLFRSKTSYSPDLKYRFVCQNHGSHVGDTFIVWTGGHWYREVESYNKRSGINISNRDDYIAIYPNALRDKALADVGYQIRVSIYPKNLVTYSNRFAEWNMVWSCMPYTFTRMFLPINSLSTYIDVELTQSSGILRNDNEHGPGNQIGKYLGAAWCKLTTNGKLFKL